MANVNLRFGISSLDAIFVGKAEREARSNAGDPSWGGITLSEKSEGTSLCLIGPDGTGKSVFSLHLASQYFWDCRRAQQHGLLLPKIIYVSTDLRYEMADHMFDNFRLTCPIWERDQPSSNTTRLCKLPTADTTDLCNFLLSESPADIGFVDLASDSAGDDWAFVTRIVSLLDEQTENNMRHMLIIDAVEGLETLAGETDAYGQKVSRRARIALLMRLASHKCHLVLIVEESKEGERLPEEFVADIVVRLRSTLLNGYTRRTLEIEKARGQTRHARGQHPFQIRSGRDKTPAYVTIYPSLHYQGHLRRTEQANRPKPPHIGFGIRHLDGLLPVTSDGARGLPGGLPFAIVGDKGTSKSNLANAFLAQCLLDVASKFRHALINIHSWSRCWPRASESAGVAVLCSSKLRSKAQLIEELTYQLLGVNLRARALIDDSKNSADVLSGFVKWMVTESESRLQIDTLVIQDQPAARLFHRIDFLVQEAKDALALNHLDEREHYRIRMVFDDISGFRDAYPELHEDPLLLPSVLQHLRDEGVSTLLVATQVGNPAAAQIHAFDATMRSLVEGYLLTWRVSFFGEARTAITFVSGLQSEPQPTIRSVTAQRIWRPGASIVDVDPDFELYEGLESGEPRPVPLEIRTYFETPAVREYVATENQLLGETFHAAAARHGVPEVITGLDVNGYDSLRDYCYLSASSKLPHTLILQVDEFWRPAKSLGMLASLRDYISTLVDDAYDADPYEDQYSLFRLSTAAKINSDEMQPHSDEYPRTRTRRDFFPEFRRVGLKHDKELIDRVPYTWDFGFLLLSHNDWYAAEATELPILSKRLRLLAKDHGIADVSGWAGITIGTTLDALRKPNRVPPVRSREAVKADRDVLRSLKAARRLFRGPSSWRAVLEASGEVMRRRAARDTASMHAFDIARGASESFSALVLEVWLSEILEQYAWRIQKTTGQHEAQKTRDEAGTFLARLASHEPSEQYTLRDLLEKFPIEFYMTWMLLVEALDFDTLVDRDQRFILKEDSGDQRAAATRHWYKTAAVDPSARYSEEPTLPVRLPGYFSTRGDWYLSMAAGSRSYRLGARALDLVNSRRANITRLQQGLGLPVRDIVDPKSFDAFRTKLSYVNDNRRRATVAYSALIGLGAESTRSYLCRFSVPPDSPDGGIDLARHSFDQRVSGSGESFFWIWRSRIKYYDRHARLWSKSLIRIALMFQGVKNDSSAMWRSGYDIYDVIALHDGDGVPPDVSEIRSYEKFSRLVGFLKDELGWTN